MTIERPVLLERAQCYPLDNYNNTIPEVNIQLPTLIQIGHGQPGEHCTAYHLSHIKRDGTANHYVRYRCKDPGCPNCAPTDAVLVAAEAAARFLTLECQIEKTHDGATPIMGILYGQQVDGDDEQGIEAARKTLASKSVDLRWIGGYTTILNLYGYATVARVGYWSRPSDKLVLIKHPRNETEMVDLMVDLRLRAYYSPVIERFRVWSPCGALAGCAQENDEKNLKAYRQRIGVFLNLEWTGKKFIFKPKYKINEKDWMSTTGLMQMTDDDIREKMQHPDYYICVRYTLYGESDKVGWMTPYEDPIHGGLWKKFSDLGLKSELSIFAPPDIKILKDVK